MNSGNDDKELHEIMRTQMGMDPDACDPATMSIIRQKFFGKSSAPAEADQSEVKTVSKKKKDSRKKKKSTHDNMDMMNNEDNEPEYLRANKEEEIHLKAPTETRKVTLGHGANKYEATVANSDQLDFGDLFNQIDHSTAKEGDKLNTTKIKKQLKSMNKDDSKQLGAKLSGVKRLRLMREQAFDHNKKSVGKYINQVKASREEVQHDFTTADKIRSGGSVSLKSVSQIASNLTEHTASSEMEKQVQAELKKQGIQSEKDLIQQEFKSLQGTIDASQLEARYKQLAKTKTLLFQQEMKNKRIKKIKAKLYHKIKKKEKQKEQTKMKKYLEEIDPEAAREMDEKDELEKIEERLRLRHGGNKNSKWQRDAKRFKGGETLDAYHEMMQEKNRLKDRMSRTQAAAKNDDSDESDSSDSDMSVDALKKKATKEIQDEIKSDNSGDEEAEDEDSDDSNMKVVDMDFKNKPKDKKQKNKPAGVMNMAFMKNAEEKSKEKLKGQSKMLIQQIMEQKQKEDNLEGSDDEESDKDKSEEGGLFNTSKKFINNKDSSIGDQIIDADAVLKAAKKMFVMQKLTGDKEENTEQKDDESSSDEDEEDDMSFTSNEGADDNKALMELISKSKQDRIQKAEHDLPIPQIEQKPVEKEKVKSKKPVKLTFNTGGVESQAADLNDLTGFNTKQKKLINTDKDQQDGNDKGGLMRQLFVTEDDNQVIQQFEKEKENEVKAELGDKVKIDAVKRGWDNWAGDGVNESKYLDKVKKAEEFKRQKIEELKKGRVDHKMRGVVLNKEDRDKKFAHKYWIKELPHPYNNVDQHNRVMDQPVGKEWQTLQSFKRIIQPEVLTKVGEIIKPLQFKQNFKPATVDSLIQHRMNKKEKRPAAKF